MVTCPVSASTFAEQHGIVACVDELRHVCPQLRERLTEARRMQSQLAEALVGSAQLASDVHRLAASTADSVGENLSAATISSRRTVVMVPSTQAG